MSTDTIPSTPTPEAASDRAPRAFANAAEVQAWIRRWAFFDSEVARNNLANNFHRALCYGIPNAFRVWGTACVYAERNLARADELEREAKGAPVHVLEIAGQLIGSAAERVAKAQALRAQRQLDVDACAEEFDRAYEAAERAALVAGALGTASATPQPDRSKLAAAEHGVQALDAVLAHLARLAVAADMRKDLSECLAVAQERAAAFENLFSVFLGTLANLANLVLPTRESAAIIAVANSSPDAAINGPLAVPHPLIADDHQRLALVMESSAQRLERLVGAPVPSSNQPTTVVQFHPGLSPAPTLDPTSDGVVIRGSVKHSYNGK